MKSKKVKGKSKKVKGKKIAAVESLLSIDFTGERFFAPAPSGASGYCVFSITITASLSTNSKNLSPAFAIKPS